MTSARRNSARPRPSRRALGPLVAVAWTLASCRSAPARPPALPPPPPPEAATPSAPLPPGPGVVRPASEPLTLAAWAEPPHLAPGGGQAQLLVRVLRQNGRPFPGVDVQFRASRGTLYSGSRVLTTDANGMTRDRITTRRTATVVVNAGGTEYTFHVPVLPREAGE